MNIDATKLEIINMVMKHDDPRRLSYILKVIQQEQKYPNITEAFYDVLTEQLSQLIQEPEVNSNKSDDLVLENTNDFTSSRVSIYRKG